MGMFFKGGLSEFKILSEYDIEYMEALGNRIGS